MDSCDKCAGVKRDNDGFAWYSDEQSQEREIVTTHRRFIVTREEAFAK